ncbi:MAG: hypothetical protein Q7U40_07270, partial [Desulfatirhabdiaceae bacterium]|nr:hypothetical protein [Desulfatirhabdiaceae bacterium]
FLKAATKGIISAAPLFGFAGIGIKVMKAKALGIPILKLGTGHAFSDGITGDLGIIGPQFFGFLAWHTNGLMVINR